jgi:DNA-nicking Smr family endonuclease
VKGPRAKGSPGEKPTERSPHVSKLSKNKSPGAKSPGTGVSVDEEVLWQHVAKSIKPIKAKPRVRSQGTFADTGEPDPLTIPERRPATTHGTKYIEARSSPRDESALGPAPPALADFDARKAKKISSGRVRIEARLDLHGMRQDDAANSLREFLVSCHARHLKTVLIITGKGREIDDISLTYVDTFDRPPRGVLRRNLPRWLAEPGLRALVVSYTSAAKQHGGDGAFYIELRRNKSAAHQSD